MHEILSPGRQCGEHLVGGLDTGKGMAAVIPPVEKKTSTIFSHASDVGVKCKATRGAWPMTPFRVVVRLVIFADEWRCSGTRGQAFRPDTGTSAIPRGRAAHRAVRDLTIPCGGKAF